jgi:hypothetical protein
MFYLQWEILAILLLSVEYEWLQNTNVLKCAVGFPSFDGIRSS